ncbi:SusD-like starch-binding protein associating with outer membrane [Chryseobacterium sp. CBTAP 102]|uniref:SusD/RagB family nutrient-binding outer membrane lipoprotein n=1 Tax=Chryseobacterium sp. CBTAP 102 TaxID=2135644 RepID=UPI000D76C2BA|nr:SusD/RagB family nutrient-binding outer membrane lipoprotein [Chryseobacterium sp. CBTAP 102]PXW11069.1 SusD-like starch-binding protein associating with outer membrane [Chryseobacterium sp. CBTAP 102]
MKKIFLILSVLTVTFISNSCADKFDEIDINPNSTDKPLSYGIFNGANKELMDNTRDEWQSGRIVLPWVQYSAQRAYTEEDRYQYRLSTGDALWSFSYRVAQDYKQIIDLNTDPATSVQMALYGPNKNQIAAARVMLSYVFLNLVDSYGDIPYWSYGNKDADFQALNIDTTLQPKFASQQKVYADIMKELKEAAAMIDENQSVFSKGDNLFSYLNNNIRTSKGIKLKKFANSLRLRVATRVKGVVPGAEAHIADAIASGVMTSNADNVGVTYENNLVNPSPLYDNFRVRSDFSVSKTFVDLLKGNSGNFGLDPRLFKYATKSKLSAAELADGTNKSLKDRILDGSITESTDPNDFKGMPYGVPSSLAPSQAASSNFFSKNILKPDYTEILMEYSEVEFLLSEANGWSQTNYVNGVKASMEKWGVNAATISSFVSGLPAASKANVLTQKYISLFMQPYEAWAEYRRTGYPNMLLLPGQTGTLNVASGGNTTYTFTSLIAGLTDLPTRLFYPTTVQTLNTANYQAASNAIGGDKMNTKLIWDKN